MHQALFPVKENNVCVCMQVEGILLSSHVIGSVVDLHNFVLINLVLDESNARTFHFSKRDLVKVIFLAENFTKGKVFETWNEILY